MFERIFEDRNPAGTPDDVRWLLAEADAAALPSLYLCCGTEDQLIDDNRALADACAAAGVPVRTSFGPGAHDWAYWDTQIQDVLGWLPIAAA